jgi:predicted O-methyltransferase YrrM
MAKKINKAKEIIGKINISDIWRGMICELIKYSKAKKVVELGAEDGITTGMITKVLPKRGKVYSVDIQEMPWKRLGEFASPDWEEKVVKIQGDDTNPDIWKGINLKKIDIWIIDSEHTIEHLNKQWAFYHPYFHKGTIIIVDDLQFAEVKEWWDTIKEDKWDNERVGVIVI